MKQESSTDTPQKKDHIGGKTKVEPCSLIVYQRDSLREESFKIVYFKCRIYYNLKGKRIISSISGRIPKYKVPILAAMNKKSVTKKRDVKIRIQDIGSNSLSKFQVGAILGGYLEYQYSGRYWMPGAQIATSPRSW